MGVVLKFQRDRNRCGGVGEDTEVEVDSYGMTRLLFWFRAARSVSAASLCSFPQPLRSLLPRPLAELWNSQRPRPLYPMALLSLPGSAVNTTPPSPSLLSAASMTEL